MNRSQTRRGRMKGTDCQKNINRKRKLERRIIHTNDMNILCPLQFHNTNFILLPVGRHWLHEPNLSNSTQSAGDNFKLQMTPDGFTLIGDEHHLFNCTAAQTDTPAAFSFECYVGSGVSVGLNVPAPLTPCFTQSHFSSPTQNRPVNHHKVEKLGALWIQPPKNPTSFLLIEVSAAVSFVTNLSKEDNCYCYLVDIPSVILMVIVGDLSKCMCLIRDLSGFILKGI